MSGFTNHFQGRSHDVWPQEIAGSLQGIQNRRQGANLSRAPRQDQHTAGSYDVNTGVLGPASRRAVINQYRALAFAGQLQDAGFTRIKIQLNRAVGGRVVEPGDQTAFHGLNNRLRFRKFRVGGTFFDHTFCRDAPCEQLSGQLKQLQTSQCDQRTGVDDNFMAQML